MLKKTKEFFRELLLRLKKSMQTRRFFEVASDFNNFVKSLDEKTIDLLGSVFLFLASLVCIGGLILFYAIMGGFIV